MREVRKISIAPAPHWRTGPCRCIRHCATVAGLGLVDGFQQQHLGKTARIGMDGYGSDRYTWESWCRIWWNTSLSLWGATRSRASATLRSVVWLRQRQWVVGGFLDILSESAIQPWKVDLMMFLAWATIKWGYHRYARYRIDWDEIWYGCPVSARWTSWLVRMWTWCWDRWRPHVRKSHENWNARGGNAAPNSGFVALRGFVLPLSSLKLTLIDFCFSQESALWTYQAAAEESSECTR